MKIVNPFDGSKAKAGDRVYSLQWGWGTVRHIFTDGLFPIGVFFDEGAEDGECFTKDGKRFPTAQSPDLYYGPPEIIGPPKPKRMVKKTVKKWANVYPWGFGGICQTFGGICQTKEIADYNAGSDRIACVELTGTYEVEED